MVQGSQTGQKIVGEGVAVGFTAERFAGPAIAIVGSSIELLQTVDKPGLLLLEHFHVPNDVGWVVRTIFRMDN